MKVYIKNSKLDRPGWLRGIATRVDVGDEEVATIYFRRTKTRRRVWDGENAWDLFYILPESGYTAVEVRGQELPDRALALGVWGGEYIGVEFRPILKSPIPLPNGSALPWVLGGAISVKEMGFTNLPPVREVMEAAWYYLAFTQRVGDEKKEEVLSRQDQDWEVESWFAHKNPCEYREMLKAFGGTPDILRKIEEKLGWDQELLVS